MSGWTEAVAGISPALRSNALRWVFREVERHFINFSQADFWPEIIWGLPVIRPKPVPTTPRIAVTPTSGFLDNGHRLIGKPRRRCRP